MESEEHMAELSETQINLKNKLSKPTILDSFTKLTSDFDKVRLNAGVRIIQHLTTQQNDKIDNEQKYALDRLVRGVGSSRTSAKTGFYTVLVSFLTNSSVSIQEVLEAVNKHLSTGGSNSKSENADISMGQILVCGALIHSDMFNKASTEEQNKIIETLINAGSKRSYLTLASYTFLNELLNKCDEVQFKNVLWPIVKTHVSKPWEEQQLDTIYFLALSRKLFPSVVKQKFINKILGTPDVVHEDSIQKLCELLLNVPSISSIKHPIYKFISKEIVDNSLVSQWCIETDKQLIKPTRNKHLVTTEMLTYILESSTDTTHISEVLTKQYVTVMVSTFKNTKKFDKSDDFITKSYKLFDILEKTIKKEDISTKTKVNIIKKLIFNPGTLIFEKITHSKLIQHITMTLDEDGVEKLTKIYKDIVLNKTSNDEHAEKWINMDRIYAAQLFVKLIGHQAIQKNTDWKLEQMKFLLKHSLLKTDDIGIELSASLKDSFYRALDLKLPKLEDLRNILSHLVHYINDEVFVKNKPELLRTALNEDATNIWIKMIQIIETLEHKNKFKNSYAVPVFHTLLLNMGLQLLSDYNLASNCLKELFSCYDRLKGKKVEHSDDSNEPEWIEVIVDLFLNLYSQNSHLLRSVIGCVFPYLCPHLTLNALHQILDVLDPKNEENPLEKKIGKGDDDESEEDEDESENDEKNESSEDEGSDVDESDMDDEKKTALDKLRMTVREALHKNGYQTDDESVDLDKMDDSEGTRLDEALADAFKNIKKSRGKNMKQNKDDKSLTHFRVRVLDLIEMYLDSEPKMFYCLEISVSLLQILEFSIRDVHQKPLENRVRSCLKKLSNLKKFSDTDDVNETVLIDILNSLLDKGSKSSLIYQDMGDKISDCCIFIIRCSQIVTTKTKLKKLLKSPLVEIIRTSLEQYFIKRDSLIPIVLFKNILQISWDGIWALIPLLIQYPFDENIRPFRRSQALELLRIFYTNNRFCQSDPDTFKTQITSIETTLSEKTIQLFETLRNNQQNKVKEKFVCNLLNLLTAVKNISPTDVIDWQKIGELIREYRSTVTLAKDAKDAYNKLCRSLGIPNKVKMNLKTETNGIESSSDDDTAQNDKSENNDIKQSSKTDKKRKKNKSLEKQKLKKEAKLLRIKASSEGLDFDFSNVPIDVNAQNEMDAEIDEEETETKNKSNHKKRNSSESSDSLPKKKKKIKN